VKSDGTTTRLLRAAKAAETRDGLEAARSLCLAIQEDHEAAARRSIKNLDLIDAFVQDLRSEITHLVRTLEAVHQLEEVSVRVEDKILSLGERLSCLFMTALLEDKGVPAQLVDLSSVINDHGVPELNRDGAYKALAIALGKEVLKTETKLPVVTGHFGFVPQGLLHSIGRGYTDLSAALVAIGIGARELQIWKEVDGIFSADPRKVPTARLLPSVSPSEAAELTFYGSEVSCL
jgi:aspartate kinase